MTLASYKTKLATHASTAGCGLLFGWFDEINDKLRDNQLTSPFFAVEPTKWAINNRYNKFTIPFKCNAYIVETTTREAAFDALVVKINSFIAAINTDENLAIPFPDIQVDLVDFGSLVENYYVISFETNIDIVC